MVKPTERDSSLQGNAVRRAQRQQVPKTLTPYEWQQWYAEHGVPQEHRNTTRSSGGQLLKVKMALARMLGVHKG